MSRQLFPPDVRLFLLCANPAAPDDAIRALVRGPLHWHRFCDLVQRDHAAPVVWQRLAAAARTDLPRDVAAVLDGMARVTTFRMMYLEQRLAETSAVLADAGLPCLLLKGAALATAVYRSFTERAMVDLDVLVPRTAVDHALQVLLRSGWALPADKDWRKIEYHHLPALLDSRGMHLTLELHTEPLALGHPFGLTSETMLAAASPAPDGLRASVPSPEHLLLHACIHFMWQHMGRMHAWRAFRDVHAIAQQTAIDWERFVTAARETRAATCCYWTFRLARDLAGLSVPSQVLRALRPPVPKLVRGVVARHLAVAAFPAGVDCPSASVRRAMWTLALQPSRSGHRAVRPWHALTMSQEARERRGVAAAEAAVARRAIGARVTDWIAYGHRLLAGA